MPAPGKFKSSEARLPASRAGWLEDMDNASSPAAASTLAVSRCSARVRVNWRNATAATNIDKNTNVTRGKREAQTNWARNVVLPPLLLVALLVAVVVAVAAVQDGDSTWLEGGAMITLYVMVATAFWWG